MTPQAMSHTHVKPGERTRLSFAICTLWSGVEVALTIHVVRGRQPGPTLALLSTSHGAEFFSIEQIRAVVESVDPASLRGTLLACPVANPIALEQLRTVTPSDEINMNRVYPGRPPDRLHESYAGGVTEHMAYLVSTHVIDPCDVLIDFHLGPYGQAIEVMDVPTQAEPARLEEIRALASLFGITLHEWTLFSGSAVGYAVSQEKLAFGAEIGGGGFGDGQTRAWLGKATSGVLQAMRYMGMLTGEVVWPEEVPVVTARAGIRPRHGGYHVPTVSVADLGNMVEAGQVLGRTYHVQTFEQVDELLSPYRGLLYMVRTYGPIHPGEWGYVVGDANGMRTYRPPRRSAYG